MSQQKKLLQQILVTFYDISSVLDTWIEKHSSDLFTCLRPDRDVLFGEWLYAKHSIHYTSLPDYFLAFDIYDKQAKRFFSTVEKLKSLEETGITCVRSIGKCLVSVF